MFNWKGIISVTTFRGIIFLTALLTVCSVSFASDTCEFVFDDDHIGLISYEFQEPLDNSKEFVMKWNNRDGVVVSNLIFEVFRSVLPITGDMLAKKNHQKLVVQDRDSGLTVAPGIVKLPIEVKSINPDAFYDFDVLDRMETNAYAGKSSFQTASELPMDLVFEVNMDGNVCDCIVRNDYPDERDGFLYKYKDSVVECVQIEHNYAQDGIWE